VDIERTIQFIIEQQAQLTASIQLHSEQIARNSEQIAALTASVQTHDVQIARHDAQIARIGDQIGVLTDLVGRLAQAEIRLAEQIQGHEARLGSLETKATQLFDRMDRFIQGLEGNGHKQQ